MNSTLLLTFVLAGAAPDQTPPADPKKHWAYQPPVKAAVPGPGNPIDAFLDAERAKHRLPTNPQADRATLLRRVYLDLVGLPPKPEELQAFLKDASPDAYEKVVDRLLASPQYGERWGRHWMDVWRYSDPFGLGEEYRYSQRHIWRWRDWIIESLNRDLGYDRMIIDMLAADEIAPADRDRLRATGYLARNWYKFNRNVWIQDSVEYTAAGFLGVTIRCARCHDHKYDPISQAEYYRFRAYFEPHDVRIDPMPGQPDVNKDGLARVFDKTLDAPTYLFHRGDERTPDKSKAMLPGVPAVLGKDPVLAAIKFTSRDFAPGLEAAAAEARRLARKSLDEAETGVRQAEQARLAARKTLDDIAAGRKSTESQIQPLLHDTFARRDDKLWKVVSGNWAWENGKLVLKMPGNFATISTTKEHPAAFMGRVRWKTVGGGIGSVGFEYDAAGNGFQAVYINARDNTAVRPFHRVNGADTYPADAVTPFLTKFNDELTVDFAVRDQLLNVWVNGKLLTVYKLPIARKAGVFALFAHDATVEFSELRLYELPASVVLAQNKDEQLPSPVGGPIVLTKDDAVAMVKHAERTLSIATARLEVAKAEQAAVEARYAADAAQFAELADAAKARSLAVAAGRAERMAAVRKAEEAVLLADAGKLAGAKKALADAVAAAAKDDPAYAPLVKVGQAESTGRRLALARWIADRRNPLTARVAVNHIWMRHFGTPLVPTVANFGLGGKPPSHPELLDWLAVEFMENGWSMKKLHRLMVTSRAYRLGSQNIDGPSKTADPANRFYWRANPRRMEGEVIRDSLLAVADQLDLTMGGPILDEKLGMTSKRRSVYFRFNAEYKMQFLDQFDAASPTECFERRESVIPQQALALHNSALALTLARDLAKKLSSAHAAPTPFVGAAFERILGRPPTAVETARCEAFLKEQAEIYRQPGKLTPFPGILNVTPPSPDPNQRAREDLIGVLFNHNDFVTVR